MGNAAYDARRAAEKAAWEKQEAAQLAAKTALEGLTAFFNGKAHLDIQPGNVGFTVYFVEDQS